MKTVDRYDHQALENARLKKAWSKSKLAMEAEMNYQGVIRVLNGRAGIGLVHRACKALGMDHMLLYQNRPPVRPPVKPSVGARRAS